MCVLCMRIFKIHTPACQDTSITQPRTHQTWVSLEVEEPPLHFYYSKSDFGGNVRLFSALTATIYRYFQLFSVVFATDAMSSRLFWDGSGVIQLCVVLLLFYVPTDINRKWIFVGIYKLYCPVTISVSPLHNSGCSPFFQAFST